MASHSHPFWDYLGGKSLRDGLAHVQKRVRALMAGGGRRLLWPGRRPEGAGGGSSSALHGDALPVHQRLAARVRALRLGLRARHLWRLFRRHVRRSDLYRHLQPVRRALAPLRRLVARAFRYIGFNSLLRRIVVTNLIGLLIFFGGILWLDQYRARLMGVKAKALFSQGEMIARTIAWAAAVNTDEVVIGPENVLDANAETASDAALSGVGESGDSDFELGEFPIDPERAAPLLQRIMKQTGTRARIYDKHASLILDTNWLYGQGQIIRMDAPPIEEPVSPYWAAIKKWFRINILGYDHQPYVELGNANGMAYQEVRTALLGTSTQALLMDDTGEHVVMVAVPIQHFKAVLGVLLLSASGKDIAETIAKDRRAVFNLMLLAAGITLLLSLWLSSTIATPMHKLTTAAEVVRRNIKARRQIPDMTDRGDEIGHLSGTIRAMTEALYRRLDAIESFAADVSHELKNPLTSLRSAVETLPLAKKPEDRDRLVEVILHDVQRLDRLITDISDASRLDAELALRNSEPVDLAQLLGKIVPVFNDIHRSETPRVLLEIRPEPKFPEAYVVCGHDSRLGQVITNVVDNAISFSPEDGQVRIAMFRDGEEIVIHIDDEGPGIPPDNLEKIFKRFYTDRPGADNFGRNSGLGLNISRQIVNAHGGRIWAENLSRDRSSEQGAGDGAGAAAAAASADGQAGGERRRFTGARFVIRLPARHPRPSTGGAWRRGRGA